jgi:hypothetical protein
MGQCSIRVGGSHTLGAALVALLVACSGAIESTGNKHNTTSAGGRAGASSSATTAMSTSSSTTGGSGGEGGAAPPDASSGGAAGADDAGQGAGGSSGGGGKAGASGSSGSDGSSATVDCFGTKILYPTKASGREWCLPSTADKTDDEWSGGGDVKTTNEPGVFHVSGSPRIAVTSPADKEWWRNVEVTIYVRLQAIVSGSDIEPEWQLYARGERHTEGNFDGATINRGRPAPPGTATWPWYPRTGSINGHCVATSYKAYLFPTGRMMFKKEISHTAGYTEGRDTKDPLPSVSKGTWIGFKEVVRNFKSDTAVHMESWLDKNADGNWTKINDVDDTGGWAGGSNPDGCGNAPYNYKNDQIVTWAGPDVDIRFDNLSSDFKAMSVREIDPLP